MRPLLLAVLLYATTVHATEPMCGTSPANDARVLAVHERTRQRMQSLAVDPSRPATLRDGAFYLQTDETTTPGYRPFDLAGQSLVFTPAGDDAFTMRRTALQYVEPSGAPRHEFFVDDSAEWHYVAYELPFAVPLFGQSVTRIYVSAYNGIHTAPPPVQGATHFDAAEVMAHRGALLSPLALTEGKVQVLEYPTVWVETTSDAVIVTWRSSANIPFGYDLQAKIATDGKITYSYRHVTAVRWGTPVLSRGFNPAQVTRTLLRTIEDNAGEVGNSVPAALRPMLDVRKVDSYRLADSDVYAMRITVGAPIDRTQLGEDQRLIYHAVVGPELAIVEIGRDTTRVASFSSLRYAEDGAAAHIDGATIELYGVQHFDQESSARVRTYFGDDDADTTTLGIPFTPAPRKIARDLSSVAQDTPLPLPIAEPFALGALDPVRTSELVRKSYGVSTYDYDAVAIFQSFFTDLIFYAGAYATRGNPQVDGIAPRSRGIDADVARSPTLLHMNQLEYGYFKGEQTASQVMLHEFGHRWLYHFLIEEDGQTSSALNPVSSHPASYVHTPSAFPVFGPNESSVMGGAYYTPQPDGSYRAHVANRGFSWTDLYLMGLAGPEEVQPWFYIAGTSLPREYWPPQGAIAIGQKRDVDVGQIIAIHGPRIPSVALSQRQFRVLFVLLTENGVEATDAEVAKLNEWRALMERTFATATGGRGRLVTTFVRPGKKRAV